jgi:hypothetical protein
MVREFSGVNGSELEDPVNEVNRICKKHNIHICGIVQANENKLRARTKHFKKPSEVDSFQINKEDIKGGSALAERARLVFALTRPREMKIQYFPALKGTFNEDADLIHLNTIKRNMEKHHLYLTFQMFKNFRIDPVKSKEVHKSGE